MSQAGAARTTRPKRRKAAPVIILRNLPKGYSWGWFSREDARMHLQTVDPKNFNLYKVWLEEDGKRVFQPDGAVPSKVLKSLEAEVTKKRLHLEGRWTNFMIEKKWLTLRMSGTLITLVAYPHVPGSRFTRTVDLTEHLPGIYDPDSQMWPKVPVKPEEVVLSQELPAIEIWPQKDESLRPHILLPPILWQD
jgi:hypothetical protein